MINRDVRGKSGALGRPPSQEKKNDPAELRSLNIRIFGGHWVERWTPFSRRVRKRRRNRKQKILLTLLLWCFTEGFGGVFAFHVYRVGEQVNAPHGAREVHAPHAPLTNSLGL